MRVYKDYYYTYRDSCDQGEPERKSGEPDTLCLFHGRTLTRYVREKIGGKVLAEYSANVMEPPNFKFIYAGDRRIAMYDKTGNLHFFLNDHLGSARMVIDSTGVVKDKYKRYFAYGGGASQTVSTGQKYQYTGQPYDDDGAFDLYYYGARYYDPVLGRFTARDPKAQKYPSWSPYAYTLDNPMRFIDPDGATPEERAEAVAKAKEYVDANPKRDPKLYKYGAKGKPGKPVDCSGLGSASVKAAGLPDPAAKGKGGGVANTVDNTRPMDQAKAQPGNLVTFAIDGKANAHEGVVNLVTRDKNGNVTGFKMYHSSPKFGPVEANVIIG